MSDVHLSDGQHSLVVGQLLTHCDVVADTPRATQVRWLVDTALRERLPTALARAAEPVLDGRHGVVRVRRVPCRLDLADGLDPSAVAAGLAERIAAALQDAPADSDSVRCWPDQETYLADYLAMRLGLRPQTAWPYEELGVLEHLPPERAAAELIRDRPTVLGPLARLAARVGGPERAVASWSLSARAALVAALLRTEPSRTERAAVPGALAAVAAAVPVSGLGAGGTAPAGVSDEAAGARLGVDALPLALRVLATADLPSRAVVVAAVALLAEVRARSGPEQAPPGGVDAPGADVAQLAVAVVAAEAGGPHALQRAVSDVLARAPGRPSRGDLQSAAASSARAEGGGGALPTRFAGLALLAPSALALGAYDALGATGLAQAVWQCLQPDDWQTAATDQALAALYPVDPREVDLGAAQPGPPVELLSRGNGLDLRPAVTAREEALGGRGWSALLLADFASRLRGFEASSPEYLRRQFLRRPGTVAVEHRVVLVRLEPMPLAVVLRSAALAYPPPVLPHRGGRRLVVDLGRAG